MSNCAVIMLELVWEVENWLFIILMTVLGDPDNIWFHILWSACNFRCLDRFLVFGSKQHFHFGVMWICVEGVRSGVKIYSCSGRGLTCVLKAGTQWTIREERCHTFLKTHSIILFSSFTIWERLQAKPLTSFPSISFPSCESNSCLCCWYAAINGKLRCIC